MHDTIAFLFRTFPPAGLATVGFVVLLLLARLGELASSEYPPDALAMTITKNGWRTLERIAIILGILSFVIQVGQWAFDLVRWALH